MTNRDSSARSRAAWVLVLVALASAACSTTGSKMTPKRDNPALYFEIPVVDMKRAMLFYESVFGFDFQIEEIHGNEMAMLPFVTDGAGISGALARGKIYQPSLNGTLIYLRSEDIDETLKRAQSAGAKILFPKTKAGEHSYVAEIQDSEGNRIALIQPLK